jgi:xanthine dehydrogenase small subunit
MTLLDFIRYHEHLMGTKIGCREGDCGACTILCGSIEKGTVQYSSATSCLMPIGNAHGKHIVTIEGINTPDTHHNKTLNPIQQAMADEGATQCGFCTPGFVVSLAGFCTTSQPAGKIITSIDGNICRCTGYKSILRATDRIGAILENRKNTSPVDFAIEQKLIPPYFKNIREKLLSIVSKSNGTAEKNPEYFVGGGTDLYVQKHETIQHASNRFLSAKDEMKQVIQEGKMCVIGGSATVTDLQQSPLMHQYFPRFSDYIPLISSTQIRNMATIAGNFINGSPIGDFTIFFLALDAQIVFTDGKRARTLPLRKLYKGYKTLDKKTDEYIEKITFSIPDTNTQFHFEKVSKRRNLDIASVNSAIMIRKDKKIVFEAGLSAGGVGPVPLYLEKASAFLTGKIITPEIVQKCVEIAQTEISPISDARGTSEYKRLLLSQLIKAHFLQLFPDLDVEKTVLLKS